MKSRWHTHAGRQVLHADYAGFGNDLAALRAEVAATDALIVRQAPGSVLLLLDLGGTVASSAVVQLFKESSPHTSPYIARYALLGMTGIKRFLADKVARFTGRTMRAFDDEASALAWLVDGAGARDGGAELGGSRAPAAA